MAIDKTNLFGRILTIGGNAVRENLIQRFTPLRQIFGQFGTNQSEQPIVPIEVRVEEAVAFAHKALITANSAVEQAKAANRKARTAYIISILAIVVALLALLKDLIGNILRAAGLLHG